jgi:hypothetical protein
LSIDLWVFPINASGQPTGTAIRRVQGIPLTIMQWGTHEFDPPVEAPNGFLIGVSRHGFTAVGTTTGTAEWPFMAGYNFGNSNVLGTGSWQDIPSTFGNMMVRAEGVVNGKETSFGPPMTAAPKAFNGYTVYLDDVEHQTGITEEEFTFLNLCKKQYKAGVEGVYTSGRTNKLEITFTIVDAPDCPDTRVEELSREMFSVYPNPAKDLLHIETERTIKQIDILDVNGKVVRTWFGDSKTVDVQNIPAGHYVLRLHTDTGIVPIRIVKQ